MLWLVEGEGLLEVGPRPTHLPLPEQGAAQHPVRFEAVDRLATVVRLTERCSPSSCAEVGSPRRV